MKDPGCRGDVPEADISSTVAMRGLHPDASTLPGQQASHGSTFVVRSKLQCPRMRFSPPNPGHLPALPHRYESVSTLRYRAGSLEFHGPESLVDELVLGQFPPDYTRRMEKACVFRKQVFPSTSSSKPTVTNCGTRGHLPHAAPQTCRYPSCRRQLCGSDKCSLCHLDSMPKDKPPALYFYT